MPVIPISGMSDAGAEQLQNRWDTIARVLQTLARKGITIPDKPPPFPIPEVTTTLVDTDNQAYLITNAQYIAWFNYVTPHVSLNDSLLLQVRGEKKSIEVAFREDFRSRERDLPPSKRTSKEEVSDRTEMDPRYIELMQWEQELLQEQSFLEGCKSQLTLVMRVISRHIEVKKVDIEMNRTAGNMPQRRAFLRSEGG
jgi:hypothetical protein